MKKIAFIITTLLCIYLIYVELYKNKINYVSINDSYGIKLNYNEYLRKIITNDKRLGTYNISFSNSTIYNVYQDVVNNRTLRVDNNDYYLKKVLRESDLLVINVGMEELALNFDKYNIDKNATYFDKMYTNIEYLIQEIKKYAYGKIVFIGYYNPTNYYDSKIDELFYKINFKLSKLMNSSNILYLDMYKLVKENNNISYNIATNIYAMYNNY